MLKMKISDIDNLPFGTHITIKVNSYAAIRAVVFGKKFGLQSGEIKTPAEVKAANWEVYLGWE